GDGQPAHQVVAATIEHAVRVDVHGDVQVARTPALPAVLPTRGHSELHPVAHPGRDLHGGGVPNRLPALAPAFLAGGGDLFTGPLADRARSRRHDRTEDTPADVLDLARAATPRASRRIRSWFTPRRMAPHALLERLHGHVLLR